MEGKVSMVKMTSGDTVKEFPIEQAEWLLTVNMRGGTGWTLADDDYELTEGRLTKKAKKSEKK